MSFEMFLSPPNAWQTRWVPLFDARLHGFSDGKWAGNFGVGSRVLTQTRVWGANLYYDYRRGKNQSYNQMAVGFESLGKLIDARINGYFPVAGRKSSVFDGKYEFDFWSANAEIGFHVDQLQVPHFYFATGPYYLNGLKETAWGAQARACLDIYQYVRIEGNVSYDHIFKWVQQGRFSVMIPFGAGKRIPKSLSVSCARAKMLAERSVQRVDRFEIIPIHSNSSN